MTTTPVEVEVSDDTRSILDGLAHGDPDLLATGLELRADWRAKSGLDGRSYALVKLAALIALDAPPASYVWQVANAIAEGATPEDLVGVLVAVAPQVGGPKVVAAAPELMVALGLTLADDM
jgi:4-carboxymuconolactone decarboxylase